MSSVQEEWRPVVGAEGVYEVSSLGRIKSLPRRVRRGKDWLPVRECLLTPSVSNAGYLMVGMTSLLKSSRTVHSIVAGAFIGPPQPGMEVNHKDGNKLNNRPENLEYLTRKQNVRHAIATGLTSQLGENSSLAKLSTENVIEIRRLKSAGEKEKDIAKRFGVSRGCISGITLRAKWKHV